MLLLLCLFSAVPAAFAHDPGLSNASIRLYTNRLEAVLGFAIADASAIVELDRDHNGHISAAEFQNGATALRKAAPDALEITFDDQPASATNTACYFDANDNATVSISFPIGSFTNLVIRSKWLALLPPAHRQLVSIQDTSGQVLAERLLTANNDRLTIELDPLSLAAPPSRPHSLAFVDFLTLGIKHIWTGYDHLLFLFGLLIVSRRFGSAVTIITCFTLAHSITLAVATFDLVRIPSRIVEPLIALSIVYVGVENLLRSDRPKGRGFLAFGFGLVHGFGFASVLRELGVGANGSGIAIPLVSFNLGVELGQVAIACLLLPLIWKLQNYDLFLKRWVPACSGAIVLLGACWFIQRVWFGTGS